MNAGTELQTEKGADENTRIVVFQRLGQKVLHAVEDGTAALPDAHGRGVLVQVPVEVPDWLRSEKQRIEAFEQAAAAAMTHGGGQPRAD